MGTEVRPEEPAGPAAERAALSVELLRAAIDAVATAVAVKDPEGRYLHVNQAFEWLMGISAERTIGRTDHELLPLEVAERHDESDALALGAPEPVSSEETLPDEEGRPRSYEVVRTSLHGADGAVNALCAVWTDVTDRRSLEEDRRKLIAQVGAMPGVDELTGLPNRRSWSDELEREMIRQQRRKDPISMALIDVDRLEAYNGRNGRDSGDELLREAAEAWRRAIRGSDVIARHDDDSFAVLLPDCPLFEAMAVVERLRAATPSGLTCSAGVALWDRREPAAHLVRRAAAALHTAKRAGRDCSIAA